LLVSATNLGGIYKHFLASGDDAALLVKYTTHPKDSDLVEIDDRSRVIGISKYPHLVEPPLPVGIAGVFFLKKEFIPEEFDKSKDIVKDLILSHLHNSNVRVYFHQGQIADIGTISRITNHLNNVQNHRILDDKRGIFFDRDGTLNYDIGHLSRVEEVEVIPESEELIHEAKKKFDILGIITNQPVIARGESDIETVETVNRRVIELLGLNLSDIDIILLCPHHPEKGWPGEIKELKINCKCRKPNVGMLLDALNRLNIRATNCLFIGDSIVDLVAADRVGMSSIHLVHEKASCSHKSFIGSECLTWPELTALFSDENG
jgi:histidinol-phosphate phosphatase family protein